MRSVVKPKPYCRHCGATVKPLQRCPKCGKRSLASLLPSGLWMRH
jgi:primosomal protein N'